MGRNFLCVLFASGQSLYYDLFFLFMVALYSSITNYEGEVAQEMPDWATETMQQSRLPAHLRTPEVHTMSRRNRQLNELIGTRLKVLFDDQKWYHCVVSKFNSLREKYQLEFDGEAQWYHVDTEAGLVGGQWAYEIVGRRRRGEEHPQPGETASGRRQRGEQPPTGRRQLAAAPAVPRDVQDQHNDQCEVCSRGGRLLCCDSCNLVYHPKCLGI